MSEQTNKFLLSWDCNGLEACIDITAEKDQILFEAIGGSMRATKAIAHHIFYMETRAKFNVQRHYEIYYLETDESITKESMVEQFNDHPQAMADLVRERGTKLYSDRRKEKDVIV